MRTKTGDTALFKDDQFLPRVSRAEIPGWLEQTRLSKIEGIKCIKIV